MVHLHVYGESLKTSCYLFLDVNDSDVKKEPALQLWIGTLKALDWKHFLEGILCLCMQYHVRLLHLNMFSNMLLIEPLALKRGFHKVSH